MQHNTIESKHSNGSYELEALLQPPPSSYDRGINTTAVTDMNTNNNGGSNHIHYASAANSSPSDSAAHLKRIKEKDRKGRQIVNSFLKTHHHSNRNLTAMNASSGASVGTSSAGETTPRAFSGGVTNPTNPTNTHLNNSKNSSIHSNSKKSAKKLDEYGFIVNIDDKGNIRSEDSFYVSGGASTPNIDYTPGGEASNINVNVNNFSSKPKNIMRRRKNKLNTPTNQDIGSNSFPSINKSSSDPTSSFSNNNNNNHNHSSANHNNSPSSPTRLNRNKRHKLKLQKKLIHRREKKWYQMITEYKSFTSSKPKLKKLHSRVRKGIPNSMRGKAWVTMAQVDTRIKAMNGVYADLVEQSCSDKLGGIHEALLPFIVNDGDGDDDGLNASSSHDLDVQKQYDMENNGNSNDPSVDIMKETIERDINRTFPRHSMFYDSYSDSDDDEDDDDEGGYGETGEYYDSNHGLKKKKKKTEGENGLYDDEMSDESYDQVSLTESLGSAGHYSADMAHLIQDIANLDTAHNPQHPKSDNVCWSKSVQAVKKVASNCPTIPYVDVKKENALVSMKSPPLPPTNQTPSRKEKKKVDFATEEGGQAILRRVLRAYSLYDPEVGYCQGMNFIAGMFITFVSEEEAFWLLVYVMNAKPCRMRGLFGVGMSEAHQVLYVAEQLIAQFNPKLSKHFDRENIHITMFATQWLLTMYTSSFPFHIVTRVWDCFILEGWKVAYRVMLALLEMATPDLLKLRFEDILNYFKVLPFQVDVNALFGAMFTVPLKKRHIEKYAKEWLRKQETDKIVKQQKQRRRRKGKNP